MSRGLRARLTPDQLRRVQQFTRGGDFQRPADRLEPLTTHRQPGAAPTLGWLVFGVAMTFLAAWALPDLIAWVHSWGAR